jgi:PTS system sucrose-specific IIC component
MPIASAANFAQFGACLAEGTKAKNQKTKSVAIPASMSAALGITEPAIFGVNMRFFKPFIGGMIGGAVGALIAAFMGIGATAYGVTGIPGYLTINNALLYTIILAISGGLAFFLTGILWKEDAPKKVAAPAPAVAAPTNAIISCNAGKVNAPAIGTVVAQADIPDDTFASGVLGEGVGINPTEGVVFAPFDGEITSVADSKHAIGLANEAGMEVLIHVGVDTVAMNGEGFDDKVAEGDKVKAGQVIMTFDRDAIKKANHPDCVVVLLTNSDDFADVKLGADAE